MKLNRFLTPMVVGVGVVLGSQPFAYAQDPAFLRFADEFDRAGLPVESELNEALRVGKDWLCYTVGDNHIDSDWNHYKGPRMRFRLEPHPIVKGLFENRSSHTWDPKLFTVGSQSLTGEVFISNNFKPFVELRLTQEGDLITKLVADITYCKHQRIRSENEIGRYGFVKRCTCRPVRTQITRYTYCSNKGKSKAREARVDYEQQLEQMSLENEKLGREKLEVEQMRADLELLKADLALEKKNIREKQLSNEAGHSNSSQFNTEVRIPSEMPPSYSAKQ